MLHPPPDLKCFIFSSNDGIYTNSKKGKFVWKFSGNFHFVNPKSGLHEYSLGIFISSVYSSFLVFGTIPAGHSKLTKNVKSIPALDMFDSHKYYSQD